MQSRFTSASALALALASASALYSPLQAQDAADWNTPRALELIERARVRRAAPRADTDLANYEADAHGYVYFYLDRKDTDERTLVKVDQVALKVYWGAPSLTKQRIVGLRDVKRLPSRIYYHLDHLTVVQDEFGDVIRMGEGDEVRDVPHPAAPGADTVYDFRVADSLTLALPGSPDPVRVYQLEVRPKRVNRPAFVGSVFVDRASAHIVRMTFTFTPAAYVDRRLDYIQVSIENGLWDGRYWLPHEQRLEIRRQVPELDFPAGGVIRGTFRIGGYRFNQDLPANFFSGASIVAAPPAARAAYPFPAGIFEGLDAEGLTPNPNLELLRKQAVELVGRKYLSGLPRLRLHLANASSALRYNRAEGVWLGAGIAYAAAANATLDVSGGYAFGASEPAGRAVFRLDATPRTQLRFQIYRRELRDIGIRPGIAGALNTILAVTAGEDYLDPYFVDGGAFELERGLAGNWRVGLRMFAEDQQSATLEQESALLDDAARFRAIRPITEGVLTGGAVSVSRAQGADETAGWRGQLELEAGALEDEAYARSVVTLALHRRSADRRTSFDWRAAAGWAVGSVPAQRLFLLGGRATLPGYRYRSFAGDRFALAELEASRQLLGPWVRLRALWALGITSLPAAAAPEQWEVAPTDGLRGSVGAGLGLIYDVLRLDAVRGLNGGEWQFLLSVHPGLWDIL